MVRTRLRWSAGVVGALAVLLAASGPSGGPHAAHAAVQVPGEGKCSPCTGGCGCPCEERDCGGCKTKNGCAACCSLWFPNSPNHCKGNCSQDTL
jgi:hypothetical protein